MVELRDTVDVVDTVDAIVGRCGRSPDALIPILQAIQKQFRYLPESALKRVCETSDIKIHDLHSVATFFPQFRTRPAGRHSVCVCDGTACHLKGAPAVFDAITGELGIGSGEDTDKDGLFTVQKVRCLGCCTLAPAVQIDAVTYGHLSRATVPEMLEAFLKQAAAPVTVAPAAATNDAASAEIRIGLGSCCVAGGSERIRRALEETIARYHIDVRVKHVSCVGMCHQTPMMEIVAPGRPSRIFAKVRPEDVPDIVLDTFAPRMPGGRVRAAASRWLEGLYTDDVMRHPGAHALDPLRGPVSTFLNGQRRIATEYCGELQPTDLDEYVSLGGFTAFDRCLRMSPDDIIALIERSGLRGRGGAGFLTARKWREVRNAPGGVKYIICNGDEGDPGAFMDRMTLESYPFRAIEGMLIAAAATGATRGIFYIRAEYPLAVVRVRAALEKCAKAGMVDGRFHVEVREGAGAFVCGEESSLIASLEGRRPTPSLRPPYPAHKGLHGCPTLVNNVETLAFVPWILRHGPESFAEIGTDRSKGTKVFALAGKVLRGGLIEVPMGTTVRRIVEQIGGGVAEGRRLKAVQIGGPSGGCIPEALADLPVDYESLTDAGAMMGSGGFVVLDDTDCIVEMSRYFLSFTQIESCGKCTPCRVGTKQMLEILGRLCEGRGSADDIAALERLAATVKLNSLCGLGRTAPNPVLTSLRYFKDEFEAHINGKCPARKCKALITYSITQDCTGCTKCAQQCPAGAIAMRPYHVHEIDSEKCVRCGGCLDVCPVNAVEVD
jgi:NADH-quinone oxidoreductase subunit F